MAIIEIAKIQVRRGQETQTGVPQLEPGEFGWAQDTEHLYIGKRISEGAVDDNNTRILTENDITNIFDLLNINSTATITTPYQYRPEADHISSATIARFIQDKLDEEVSICEFGVVASVTATDISTQFQTAVNTIFRNGLWDSFQRKDARRILKIPAGNYFISNAIELPPYTTLIGEGPDLTTLTLISTTTNVFRTMDADGNLWASEIMQSGAKRARQVRIKDLTLEYSNSSTSNRALISLDNVLNASVENCILRTAFDAATTTTYGLVSQGVGIEVRGTGGGLGSGDVNLTENVHIEKCVFDSLYIGVRSTGTVIRPVIFDNHFSNLNRGIEFYTIDTLPGPSNGVVSDNRFENIVKEAIFIGTNTDITHRGNHISQNNFYIQVGNGIGLDDNITSATNTSPVLYFGSDGNKSVNDFFNRRYLADRTTSTNFYYAPFISGRASVESSEITNKVVLGGYQSILKIPLNGQDQHIAVKYQLYNSGLSRKGDLIINIAPDSYGAVTDNFNYIEYLEEGVESPEIYFFTDASFATSKNYVTLICVNNSVATTIEFMVHMMI